MTAITYLPSVRLDAQMIEHRFGHAEQIQQDPNNSNTEIWHYPALNLSIQINENEKTLILYQLH